MKLLHIADLHLGKRVLEAPMIEDARAVLGQVRDIAITENVEAVLIAGDVYDRPVPPIEAVELFSDFLTSLVKVGIKVLAIAGNHDSPERLGFCGDVLSAGGVHIAGACRGKPETVVLQGNERVAVHMISFARTAALRPYLQGEIETLSDAMSAVLTSVDRTVADRHVLLLHAFVAGGISSDSEMDIVGTAQGLSTELFSGFDYVALGHLHGPQTVGENIRYAGSPLKYSFSEVHHHKSATLISLEPGTAASWQTIPLQAPHDMREVRGALTELMQMSYSEDYIRAIVTDEEVAPDARNALQTVFPNLLRFTIENTSTHFEEDVSPADSVEARDPLSLFAEFYEKQNQKEPDEARLAMMKKLLMEEVEE